MDYTLYTAKTRFQRKGIKGVNLSEEERNALLEQGIDPDELDVCLNDQSGQLPGTASSEKASVTEYTVDNVELSEGIMLLQKRGVVAKPNELRQAVKYCNGHAGALAALALLLQQEPTLGGRYCSKSSRLYL